MIHLIKFFFKIIVFTSIFFSTYAFSDTLEKIEILGNERISDESIKLFINVNISDEIDNSEMNDIIKDLYETNFFKDISLSFNDQTLIITVIENPIIENIFYKGIKSDRILNIIKDASSMRSRSSYKESIVKNEKLKIENILKSLGYYKSDLAIIVEEYENNLVNIT